MSDESKEFTVRLSKAAKEFNVAVSTIQEFLTKKGFQVDSSPNTKLTKEMYDLVVKEYQGEKEVKNEAKKLGNLSYKGGSVSVESALQSSKEDEEEDFGDDVFIRTNTITSSKKTVKPVEEVPAAEPVEEKPVVEAPKPVEEKTADQEPKEEPAKEEKVEEKQQSEPEAKEENPENYFEVFEKDVPSYTLEKGVTFQAKTEQYQQATILKQRMDILKKAMQEVEQYSIEQDALTYAPAQNEGYNNIVVMFGRTECPDSGF